MGCGRQKRSEENGQKARKVDAGRALPASRSLAWVGGAKTRMHMQQSGALPPRVRTGCEKARRTPRHTAHKKRRRKSQALQLRRRVMLDMQCPAWLSFALSNGVLWSGRAGGSWCRSRVCLPGCSKRSRARRRRIRLSSNEWLGARPSIPRAQYREGKAQCAEPGLCWQRARDGAANGLRFAWMVIFNSR